MIDDRMTASTISSTNVEEMWPGPNRDWFSAHFWLAANMGTLAESFGEGLADRALGRWYFRVPALFGGSKKKAVEHLQRAL
jgi:hypothetical protein